MTEPFGPSRPPSRSSRSAPRGSTLRTSTVRSANSGAPRTRDSSRRDRTAASAAAAHELLLDAGRGLGVAIRAADIGERYGAAHLAALRGAAAVVASRARPGKGRAGNVWDLLDRVAPEFSDWSTYFRAGIGKRQLAEAGVTRAIGQRETDDLVRQAGQFLELVEATINPRTGGHTPNGSTRAGAVR